MKLSNLSWPIFMIVSSQIHFFSRISKISTVMRCTLTKYNS